MREPTTPGEFVDQCALNAEVPNSKPDTQAKLLREAMLHLNPCCVSMTFHFSFCRCTGGNKVAARVRCPSFTGSETRMKMGFCFSLAPPFLAPPLGPFDTITTTTTTSTTTATTATTTTATTTTTT